MPAVNFTVRWPDGRESTGYSPSTIIFRHLTAGETYPLADFIQRLQTALTGASERVQELKGFYCSSAMDSLGLFQQLASGYADHGEVQILAMQTIGTGQAVAAGP